MAAVIDKEPEGREGPWRTYARMPTLRSPKDFTGPDLDVPSLTYEAWHTARFGAASWEDLDLIGRETSTSDDAEPTTTETEVAR